MPATKRKRKTPSKKRVAKKVKRKSLKNKKSKKKNQVTKKQTKKDEIQEIKKDLKELKGLFTKKFNQNKKKTLPVKKSKQETDDLDKYENLFVSNIDDETNITDSDDEEDKILSPLEMKKRKKLNQKIMPNAEQNNIRRCQGVTKRNKQCSITADDTNLPWISYPIENFGLCRHHLTSTRRQQLKDTLTKEEWRLFKTQK